MKQMKQLKSTSSELLNLFESSILVRHVAERLVFCQADENAVIAQKLMDERDFDVLGVADKSTVYGYIKQGSLKEGSCKQYEHTFHPLELIAESAPLLDLLPILRDKPRIFVLERNRVTGIVTRGDLRKAPVRMLLFGLVSLLEMQLLRVIEHQYPNDSWQSLVTRARLDKAKEELAKRQQKNENIGLADCLQFCDKLEIVMKTPKILQALCLESKNKAEQFQKEAEELRNSLAHGQDIVTGSKWSELLVLVTKIQKVLKILETM